MMRVLFAILFLGIFMPACVYADVAGTGVRIGPREDGKVCTWSGSLTQIECVTEPGGAETLDDLSDVAITTPSPGQVLIRGETDWVNDTLDILASTGNSFSVIGGEGENASLVLDADEGDDNADTWTIQSTASDNDLEFINHETTRLSLSAAGVLTGTFSGNLTGDVTGNASTATALAANPTDCSASQFATAIDASGNLTCAALADGDIPNDITVDLAAAATALAANGTNCESGQAARGVDASGNAEDCFTPPDTDTDAFADLTDVTITTPSPGQIIMRGSTVWENVTPPFLANNGTLTDGRFCRWDNDGTHIDCDIEKTGTGTIASVSGTLTQGRCVEIDASGNLIQSAAGCNAGGGGGAENASELAYDDQTDGWPEGTTTVEDALDAIVTPVDGGPNDADSFIPFSVLTGVPAFKGTLFQLSSQGYYPPTSNFATISSRGTLPVLVFGGDVCAIWGFMLENTYGGNGVTVEFLYTATQTSNDTDWDGSWARIDGQDIDSVSFATAISSNNNNNNGTSGIPTRVTLSFEDGAQMDDCDAGDFCLFRLCRDFSGDTANEDIQFLRGYGYETPDA